MSSLNDDGSLPTELFLSLSLSLGLSLMLRSTVSRLDCLEIKHISGAYDQISITVRQFRVCLYGTPSLTRGQVCHLQLLLVPPHTSAFSDPSPVGPQPYFTLSDSRLPFPSPPTTRRATVEVLDLTFTRENSSCFSRPPYNPVSLTSKKHRVQRDLYSCLRICCRGNDLTDPLPRNISGLFAYRAVVAQ
jgi:hypothetical protein